MDNDRKSRIQKTTGGAFVLLMGITVGEKILSFLYQTVIAAKLGATVVTDSYFTSAEFFSMIEATVFSALIAVLLTQYTNTAVVDGDEVARGLLSNVLSLFLAGMVIAGVLIVCFAEWIAVVLVPGFSGEEREVLVRCLRFFAAVPAAAAFFSVQQVVLRRKKQFAAVNLKSLFISGIGILSVLLFTDTNTKNADAICVGYLVSILSYCVFTAFLARRYETISLCRPRLSGQTKNLLRLMLPMIIGNGVTRVALMIDKILASLFQEGMVSCLAYAQTLKNFVTAFFVTNICTILLTDFVDLVTTGEIDAIKSKVRNTASLLLLFLIPITVLTMIYHGEIVSIVFERGSFTGEDADTTAGLLMWYALGFIPMLLQNIFLHVHYAFSDTIAAMRNGVVAVACNLVFSIGLAFLIGVNGIAIGTVISTTVSAALAWKTMKKHLPDFRLFENRSYLFHVILAAIACAAAAFAVQRGLRLAPLWSFAVAVAVGFAAFFVVLLLVGEPMLKRLFLDIKRKIKTR